MGLFGKKKANKKGGSSALFDELTGVLSLGEFCREAEDFIVNNQGASFAVCRVSVGNIGAINEAYGMMSGDKILKKAAQVLTSDNEGKAIVARDRSKFVFMVPYSSQEEVDEWIKSLHDKLGDVGSVLEQNPKVYMHMGVYMTANRLVDKTVEEMIACAKIAESDASKRTHASVVYYSEQLKVLAQEDEILVRDMKKALEKKEFIVSLQPRFDAEENVVGAKLMTRWIHPQIGSVGAWRFIPLFVKNGFILDLDLYLLEQACALIKRWADAGKKPLSLSVNMPRILVSNERNLKKCVDLKKKYAVDDKLLELEFSERLIEDSINIMPSVFEYFRKKGFSLAIENFGAGSALDDTITTFRPDTIKFSRDLFEKGYCTDDEMQLLDRCIKTAKDTGVATAVTGVPESVIPMLKEKGIDIIQGNINETPLSIAEFENRYIN